MSPIDDDATPASGEPGPIDGALAERVVSMLEAMTDAYLALDRSWRVTYVNGEAARVFGRPRDRLVGRDIREIFPGVRNPVFGERYREVMDTGRPVEFEAHEPQLGRWFLVRAHPMDGGLTIYFRDVTERHEAEAERARLVAAERRARRSTEAALDRLEHLASHDDLTGLRSRRALAQWLTDALARPQGPERPLAVCLLDLDRFKVVNDSLGHSAGDQVLVEVATRLEALVRHGDLVARMGGDEFVIGLEGLSPEEADAVASRALEAVRAPLTISDTTLVITASLGIALAGQGASAETLLRDADVAMYRAKEQGRNRSGFYDEAVRAAVVRRLAVEADLHAALERDELVVHYQPNFDLRTGRPAGAEALVRWQHPERGLLGPDEFIPVAEESDLIVDLGAHVLRLAAADASAWRGGNDIGGPLWVNVSGRQLERPDLPALVGRVLDQHQLSPSAMGLEATETALLQDPATAQLVLDELVEMGLQIAIDDFGTGYSSLSRLAAYPVHQLKVDRSFTAGLEDDPQSPLVAAVVQLGHALGATVCAEGVETTRQLRGVRDLGADQAAGFHLAPPVPAAELPRAMAQGTAAIEAAIRAGPGPREGAQRFPDRRERAGTGAAQPQEPEPNGADDSARPDRPDHPDRSGR